jgi:DNA-binding PadR family transcriptional regulator
MRMIPEAKLIKSELILRDLSLPEDVKLARKSLIRWLALSLGLINPNESRRLVLDVIEVLLGFHVAKEAPTTAQLLERLQELSGKKPNPKAVYYHLLRLKEKGLIVRKKGRYYLGSEEWKSLPEVFNEFYNYKTAEMLKKINEALKKLDESYRLGL